jgi:hypothetical protein
MKRVSTFEEFDDTRGWAADPSDSRDHRVCKYLRNHQKKITEIPMPNYFEVCNVIDLPKTMLVDLDAVEVEGAATTVDRGDVYEAFWRTSELSLRGIFVNNEPVWGDAEYRNGMSYTGGLSGGMAHGFGVKRMGASVYKGRFDKGLRHGPGLLLQATRYSLFAGKFHNDKPHGPSLCIIFAWCTKTNTVQHQRTLLQFDHGVLTSSQKAPKVNVSNLSGLSQEEFLQIYRQGEKALEDNMTKNFMKEAQAEPMLWTPIGL